MVSPVGTTAPWCRGYGRAAGQLPGEPARGGHGGRGPRGGLTAITPAMLAGTFPGWRVSESEGTCRAAWNGPGPIRALHAADLTGLAEKLCLAERLPRRGLDAAALAVWRDEPPAGEPR